MSPAPDAGNSKCGAEPDRDRAAVYAAEDAAFAGTDLEQLRTIDAVLHLIEVVAASEWWPPSIEVTARAARTDALSSSTRPGEIRIARPQATIATAAHELAHALAGVEAGHGPRFRAAFLDCVQMTTNVPPDIVQAGIGPRALADLRRGTYHVTQLAAAFEAFELPVGDRHWEPPPWSGAIAL